MFIILEGCDGVGKTTVAKDLRAELRERGYRVFVMHRGVPKRHVLDEYQYDVEGFRPGQGVGLIADRWHWGDIVYGELYRGASALGGTEGAGFRFVELFLRSRGAVTVLMTQTPDVVRTRLAARGEDYLKTEHIEHVLKRYDEVFSAAMTSALTTSDPDVSAIITHAEFWAEQAVDLAPFPGYVGGRTPRVLLVGERRGNASTASQTAFRPTAKGNSAEWLLESLPASLWHEVGLVNAYEEDNMCGLLEVLAAPPVIALGKAASERLTELEIEHAGMPHPQYMRRFKNDQQLAYGQKLVSLIGKDAKEFSWQY